MAFAGWNADQIAGVRHLGGAAGIDFEGTGYDIGVLALLVHGATARRNPLACPKADASHANPRALRYLHVQKYGGVDFGRVALPLAERGIPVTGIEFSAAMLEQLRTKPGADAITALAGDMASSRVPDGQGRFPLVFLVFNTIGNLTTQAQQVDCFVNAAWHLAPGGHFVVEVGVPHFSACRWASGSCRSQPRPNTAESTSTT